MNNLTKYNYTDPTCEMNRGRSLQQNTEISRDQKRSFFGVRTIFYFLIFSTLMAIFLYFMIKMDLAFYYWGFMDVKKSNLISNSVPEELIRSISSIIVADKLSKLEIITSVSQSLLIRLSSLVNTLPLDPIAYFHFLTSELILKRVLRLLVVLIGSLITYQLFRLVKYIRISYLQSREIKNKITLLQDILKKINNPEVIQKFSYAVPAPIKILLLQTSFLLIVKSITFSNYSKLKLFIQTLPRFDFFQFNLHILHQLFSKLKICTILHDLFQNESEVLKFHLNDALLRTRNNFLRKTFQKIIILWFKIIITLVLYNLFSILVDPNFITQTCLSDLFKSDQLTYNLPFKNLLNPTWPKTPQFAFSLSVVLSFMRLYLIISRMQNLYKNDEIKDSSDLEKFIRDRCNSQIKECLSSAQLLNELNTVNSNTEKIDSQLLAIGMSQSNSEAIENLCVKRLDTTVLNTLDKIYDEFTLNSIKASIPLDLLFSINFQLLIPLLVTPTILNDEFLIQLIKTRLINLISGSIFSLLYLFEILLENSRINGDRITADKRQMEGITGLRFKK